MRKFSFISLPLCAVVLAGLLVALTPGPVQAGGPPPCAGIVGPSDCVTVTIVGVGAFSFGFSDVLAGPAPEPPVLVVLPLPVGIPGGPLAIEFTEPLFEPNGGQASDILLLNNGQLFFASDVDPLLLDQLLAGLPLLPPLVETGGAQDVSGLLHLTNITVTVQSDVIPEPSTWILLGSGLAGLAYWRRRKAMQS